jgi:hypothetical protein
VCYLCNMTRATIAMQLPHGKVISIRCHQDGEPTHLGNILLSRFGSSSLINLIIGGDISSLQVCSQQEEPVFVRGNQPPSMLYADEESYHKDGAVEAYNYLRRQDGLWYVSTAGSPFAPFTQTPVHCSTDP